MAISKQTEAKTAQKHIEPKSPRTHQKTFMLNDKENKALENYFKKYNINNRSRFIRETIMITIIKQMENDSPKLFD